MENTKKIQSLGEKLRSRYLFNIYNDTDLVLFLEIDHKEKKKINNKIIKLIL